jgi:hypothetical protein
MRPRPDPILIQASLRLAKADESLANTRLHMEQSVEACARSLRLLRRTVPVLRHADGYRQGKLCRERKDRSALDHSGARHCRPLEE